MKYLTTFLCLCVFVSAAFASHEKVIVKDDIAFLFHSNPNAIARYDLANEQWLETISLPLANTATGFEINNDEILVSYGNEVYRYNLDGNDSTLVWSEGNAIRGIKIVNDFLLVRTYGRTSIVRLSDFTLSDYDTSYYSRYHLSTGLSSADSISRLFGRSSGISPADIAYMEIDAAGAVVASHDSPHHGAYPSASKTYVFPDESKVVDNAGVIYSTQSLAYLGSFAGGFIDLAFLGDLPIILRAGEVTAYTNTLLASGSVDTTVVGERALATYDSKVFIFGGTGSSYSVERFELSEFASTQPNEPIDPNGLPYTPDSYAYDEDDNVVYMLSKLNTSVFRWSVDTEEYLTAIPLIGVPEYMTVDTSSNVLYLAYENGRINKIDLNDPELAEESFVALAYRPLGLSMAGSFVFACDAAGAWESHYTFSPAGSLISAVDWNYSSREFIWNDVNQRMYFFRDGSSPNDLLWEVIDSATGTIGEKRDSPYHSSSGIQMPIRVKPDGEIVVLGSGRIYGGISLSLLHTLPNNVLDTVWLDSQMVTIKGGASSSTILQTWAPDFSLVREIPVGGEPLRIFSVDDELLVITGESGIPQFTHFSLDALPDDDEDGVDNFMDNCPEGPNPSQADADNDDIGDACDDDADNDGISNDIETLYGLDPNDPSDAQGDLDGDGFDNLTEILKGSDLSDPTSTPPYVIDLLIDFENGQIPGFFETNSSTNQGWVIDPNNGAGVSSKSMRASTITHGQTSGVIWNDFFVEGVLEFDVKVESESCCDYMYLYVDGSLRSTFRHSSSWAHYILNLSTGEHAIEWRYRKDGSVDRYADTSWVDNIRYFSEISQDQDDDGIPDYIDNCVFDANSQQEDVDGDGIGNACNDLFDGDDDEWADSQDNCPGSFNPDQANNDADQFGDNCDPFPEDADNLGACLIFSDEQRQENFSMQSNIELLLGQVELLTTELRQLEDQLRDTDDDSIIDTYDACSGSLSTLVDPKGCTVSQFCSQFTSQSYCNNADWQNDEPLNAHDCGWSGKNRVCEVR